MQQLGRACPRRTVIYSVGHSSLPAEQFVALLTGAPVAELWDIRSYPSSHWPWFGRDELESGLAAAGIAYRWVPALGGRRGAPRRPVPPAASRWRSPGFEHYMWHMATPEFLTAAGELLLAGRRTDLAILCSESLWWRCHRSMVADFVVYAGGEVVHLQPARTPHSAAIGDRLARYAPDVLAAWDDWLAPLPGERPSSRLLKIASPQARREPSGG